MTIIKLHIKIPEQELLLTKKLRDLESVSSSVISDMENAKAIRDMLTKVEYDIIEHVITND